MEDAYILLLGYALWMQVLLFLILVVRVRAGRCGVALEKVSPDNKEISSFAYRVSRAHANCYENFAILIVVVFVAAMTETLHVMSGTALIFLIARLAQSSVHLYSGAMKVCAIRGMFFAVQVTLILYWIVSILLNIG